MRDFTSKRYIDIIYETFKLDARLNTDEALLGEEFLLIFVGAQEKATKK